MNASCDPEKRHRRSIRLRDYDYSRAGAYFLTVCTEGRKLLFGEVKGDEVVLNELGRIAAEEWQKSAQVRIEIDLDAWVVMPSHVHGIVVFTVNPRRGDRPVAPAILVSLIMTTDLKSYPAYKDSGVEWLGKVPEQWDIRRVKYLLKECDTRSVDGGEELLRVSQYTGVTLRSPTDDGDEPDTRAASLIGYKCVEPNDLVVNIMLAWNGSLGVSQFCGIASPAYCVYRFNAKAHPWYFHHLLRSPVYKARVKAVSTGVVESRLRLYTDDLYRLEALVPPLAEQHAIVRFLDHADRRIRRYIRAKQKLIALLEEQKQATIHQAVTGKVDVRTGQPYSSYKDTDAEWLGNVPMHWEIRRLRSLIIGSLTYGANAAAEHNDTTWPRYLRITDFSKNGKLRKDTFQSLPPDIAKDYLVEPGDVLLARSGATVGKAFLVDDQAGTACHAGYLIRARINRKLLDPSLFFAFTQCAAFEKWKDSTIIISTIQNISAEKYSDLPVPVPPRSEQDVILQFVRMKKVAVDRAVHRATEEIDLIREYRTRLIADVVTGKLDVREAAAELPDAIFRHDVQSDEQCTIEEDVAE